MSNTDHQGNEIYQDGSNYYPGNLEYCTCHKDSYACLYCEAQEQQRKDKIKNITNDLNILTVEDFVNKYKEEYTLINSKLPQDRTMEEETILTQLYKINDK